MRTKLVRILLLILGFLSLTLGIIGVFLPLLPTTPFLLLAAWLFFRSSSRAYQWLLNSRLAGNYIRAFREQRAIPLHAKVISIFLLWLSISYSIFWVVSHTWIKVLLMGIAIGVSIHILSYNTLVKNRKE